MMWNVVGYLNKIKKTLTRIEKEASHSSSRIREVVAIGIQKIKENNIGEIITNFEKWTDGDDLEKRALVAALCEPKLLKGKSFIVQLVEILNKITMSFGKIEGKVFENQNSLRKTLGYGWSIAVGSLPDEGKLGFEKIA